MDIRVSIGRASVVLHYFSARQGPRTHLGQSLPFTQSPTTIAQNSSDRASRPFRATLQVEFMALYFFALLLWLCYDGGLGESTKHLLTSLPGWDGDLPFNMYSGYLDASDTSRHFYIYVESEEIDPSVAPISLWLNGGPGCSSLDGFWTEHGPFAIKRNLDLELRPYRWNRLSNMLYMEAPVGVGLSYSTIQNYNNSDDRTAVENEHALNEFFSLFPHLKTHDFYLTGESYAGIYVPTLAEAILDAEEAGTWDGPPLKGIAVGNGCTGTEIGICGFYEGNACNGLYYEYKFLGGLSFFEDELKDKIDTACDWDRCLAAIPSPSNGQLAEQNFTLSSTCLEHLEEALMLIGDINVYDVMGTCGSSDWCETDYRPLNTYAAPNMRSNSISTSTADKKSEHSSSGRVGELTPREGASDYSVRITKALRKLKNTNTFMSTNRVLSSTDDAYSGQNATEGPAECMGSASPSAYMNRQEVIDAFHARDNGFCWGVCNRAPTWRYNATRPNLPRDLYPRLIGNLKVLIYNGDVDACVPYTDNEAWTENMGYNATKEWHAWSYTDLDDSTMYGTQVAGYAVEYDVSHLPNDAGTTGRGSFTFRTIRGAGHMVPDTRPAPALEMFRRFLDYDPKELYPFNQETSCTTRNLEEEAALTIMIVLFIISVIVSVCLYLRLRELEYHQNKGNGRDGDFGRGEEDSFDTKLDISDRDVTHNPMNGDEDEEDEGGDGDKLTTIELSPFGDMKRRTSLFDSPFDKLPDENENTN